MNIDTKAIQNQDQEKNRTSPNKSKSSPISDLGAKKDQIVYQNAQIESFDSRKLKEQVGQNLMPPIVPSGAVSSSRDNDNGSQVESNDPYSTQILPGAKGIEFQTTQEPNTVVDDDGKNKLNSPSHQGSHAGKREEGSNLPRMQIRLPPPGMHQRDELSPAVETNSRTIMKRKLDSDNMQSQFFQQNQYVHSSDYPASSGGLSAAPKKGAMNFDKRDPPQSQLTQQMENQSPQTLRQSARQLNDDKHEKIHIGAKVISTLAEIDNFAKQVANQKDYVPGKGTQRYLGEPIAFDSATPMNHCSHCPHFNFLDIKEYRHECKPETCCKEHCTYDQSVATAAKQNTLAFIDYSSSIDHTAELQATYMKYKQVVDRLKKEYLLFSQQQPKRRRVADVAPVKTFVIEPQTILDKLTQYFVDKALKKRGTEIESQSASQQSILNRENQAKNKARRMSIQINSNARNGPDDTIGHPNRSRFHSIDGVSPIFSQEHVIGKKSGIKSPRQSVQPQMGIDGRVSKFFVNTRRSIDHAQHSSLLQYNQRNSGKLSNSKRTAGKSYDLSPHKLTKRTPRDRFNSSQSPIPKSTARNQDIIETMEDAELRGSVVRSAEKDQSPIEQLKCAKVETQYRRDEPLAGDGHIATDLNYIASIAEPSQPISNDSVSQDQLKGFESIKKYKVESRRQDDADGHLQEVQSPQTFEQREDALDSRHQQSPLLPPVRSSQSPQLASKSFGVTRSPNIQSNIVSPSNEIQMQIIGLNKRQDQDQDPFLSIKMHKEESGVVPRQRHNTERIDSLQDGERTATLSRTYEKKETEYEHECPILMPNLQTQKQEATKQTVKPQEFILQMQTYPKSYQIVDDFDENLQSKSFSIGQPNQRMQQQQDRTGSFAQFVQGLTNQHQNKVKMPFNHFVHPQSPPLIGSKKNKVVSSARRETRSRRSRDHRYPSDESPGGRAIFNHRYNGKIESSIHDSENQNGNIKQGIHSNHQMAEITEANKDIQLYQRATMNVLSNDDVAWDAGTQDRANAGQSCNISRSQSAAKREEELAKQETFAHVEPIKEGQTIRVTSYERDLVDGPSQRFRNRGIANKISRILNQGTSLVNSVEQSDFPIQVMMLENQRKQDANQMSKKVQFKSGLKSTSISPNESRKQTRLNDAATSSQVSDQLTKIDPGQISMGKQIVDEISRNNKDMQVALRELHAKCSNSLENSVQNSKRQFGNGTYLTNDSKQKFAEPISMRSTTDFMKKIKIGGSNDALRKLLDQTIKYQMMKATSPKDYIGIDQLKRAIDAQTGSKEAGLSNQEALKVVFKNRSQLERFDPQLAKVGSNFREQLEALKEVTPPISPGYPVEHRRETEYEQQKIAIVANDTVEPVKENEDFSGSQSNVHNTRLGKTLPKLGDQTFTPNANHVSPELLTMKTISIQESPEKDNVRMQSVPFDDQNDQNNQNKNIGSDKQSQAGSKLAKVLQHQSIDSDSRQVKRRRISKKKTSGLSGGGSFQYGGTFNHEGSHTRKQTMNLDILDSTAKVQRKGSSKRLEINGGSAARKAPNRDLKNEAGFEKVKLKVQDIHVQSHASKIPKMIHRHRAQELMSSLDREETINELMVIEAQMAQLLKDPDNVSTRRYRKIPKEQLINTLRQYVFEQTFKLDMDLLQQEQQHESNPVEIVGGKPQIQSLDKVQQLFINRLNFNRYLENLTRDKVYRKSKLEQSRKNQDVKLQKKEELPQKVKGFDLQEFDQLIKQMHQVQQAAQSINIETLKNKFPNQENILPMMVPQEFTTIPSSFKLTLNTEPDHLQSEQSGGDYLNDEILKFLQHKGYLLYQPKSNLARYTNQKLLNRDHLFLNDEHIIKSNIVNENFYKIREANKIAKQLDLVEGKLLDKMEAFKASEHTHRQKLVDAGVLDHDVQDASEIINVAKQVQKRQESGQDDQVQTQRTFVYDLDEDVINVVDTPVMPRLQMQSYKIGVKEVDRVHAHMPPPSRGNQMMMRITEPRPISSSYEKSQQPSTKVIMSSMSEKSKHQIGENTDKMKETEPGSNIRGSAQRHSNTNEPTTSDYKQSRSKTNDAADMGLKVNIQVKAPQRQQNDQETDYLTNGLQKLIMKEDVIQDQPVQAQQVHISANNRYQEALTIVDGQVSVPDEKLAVSEKMQEQETSSVPQRAPTSTSVKTNSIFNRDQLRFQGVLNFKNKQRVTRQSIQKAFKDNYILAEIKTRQAMKSQQNWQPNARQTTLDYKRRMRGQGLRYRTIDASDWSAAVRQDYKAQTCVNSIKGSIEDENPLTDLNDSALEKSAAQNVTGVESWRPLLEGPTQEWPNPAKFDRMLDKKIATQGDYGTIHNKKAFRDTIQSQHISERRLQNMIFTQPRQSVNLQQNTRNQSLIQGGNIAPFESFPTTAVPRSRAHQGTSFSISQCEDYSSRGHQPGGHMFNNTNRTGRNESTWVKSQKQDSNSYLNYVDNKKPLLPALITNQIAESKRRRMIESGLANSVDFGQTARQQPSSDYRGTAATGRDHPRQDFKTGRVNKSLALASLSKKLDREVDFSEDFKLDSARLYNHDIFLQRSQRESVTKGFQKGQKLQTKFQDRTLTALEQKAILDKILGVSKGNKKNGGKYNHKDMGFLSRKYLQFENELRNQYRPKATDRTSRETLRRPVESGSRLCSRDGARKNTSLAPIVDKATSDPLVIASSRQSHRAATNDERTFHITQDVSRPDTATAHQSIND